MNQGILGLSVFVICYGLLTGAFLYYLKAHFMSTKINRILFAVFLFAGLVVNGVLCENGILSGGQNRALYYLLLFGMTMPAFCGAWEKKLLALAVLIVGNLLAGNFFASFMTALTLFFRHEILRQPVTVLESWQDAHITVLAHLAVAAVICFLSKKSGSLFEEKSGKWYLMSAGPLYFIILAVEANDWCVGRGVIFWGGESMGIYENQLFSHGAVCLCTMVCMFAAAFYVYGMDRIYRDWQKKEQYRLQVVYLEGIKEQNEQTERIRHDIKNHMVSLQGFLAEGNLEKLKEYIDRIAENGGIKGMEEVTGNRAVDALLCEKKKQAEKRGVEWRCDMQPWKEGFLNEFDFCILAGNALDNAIEACESMEDEGMQNGKARDGIRMEACEDMKDGGEKTNKYIHIQTGWVKDYFLFEVKNSAGGKAAGKGKTSVAGKAAGKGKTFVPDSGKEARHRGIGLLNIKETVGKYNGILNAESKKDMFILSVLIPRKRI